MLLQLAALLIGLTGITAFSLPLVPSVATTNGRRLCPAPESAPCDS